MMKIYKVRADHVLDHAASELKKYLRMMMPDGGDVKISLNSEATDGFRLGLLEDFGIPFEGSDARLDDVIHVEAGANGGILAGSNPRSVLFAVYRFLRENGCRWLYPGVDGDYVPMKAPDPVSYHKMASHRFRGFCNEGTESQQVMIEIADYYAKLEMNVYMLEFFIPSSYYNRHYNHTFNEGNRQPEPVSEQQILQWKRQTEVEISKRGLMFHDIGHGWTSKPFGTFHLTPPGRNHKAADFGVPPETIELFALVKGKRDFWCGQDWLTNLCMSRPEVRTKIAKAVAEYAETHSNSDYLHVWLADGNLNHCECEECKKMIPSDWYMMIMNEIDEELSKKNLNTRIVFIAYVDTLWGPEKITIKNPERFSLLYAPVTRSYTSSITENSVIPEPLPYVRNAWQKPVGAEENLALLNTWKKTWKGPIFCYEYHFWRHQFNDPGGITFAKRIWEDIRGIKYMGIDGFVEDGSQRSGFPNAFPVYVYAATLFDREIPFEDLMEDYFSHIYGKDWKEAVSVLIRIGDAFDFAYMEGEKSADPAISPFYNPEQLKKLDAIEELCAEERALLESHMIMPTRPQTVSWRMLGLHADYCEQLAKVVKLKAEGHNFEALEQAKIFYHETGKREIEFEPYYDHCLACRVVEQMVKKPQKIIID